LYRIREIADAFVTGREHCRVETSVNIDFETVARNDLGRHAALSFTPLRRTASVPPSSLAAE
jgi:hypothetical protein